MRRDFDIFAIIQVEFVFSSLNSRLVGGGRGGKPGAKCSARTGACAGLDGRLRHVKIRYYDVMVSLSNRHQ